MNLPDVPVVARSMLGLTSAESVVLFTPGNDLADIDGILAGVYTRAGDRP